MAAVKVSFRVTVTLFACIFSEVMADVGYPKESPSPSFDLGTTGLHQGEHIPSSSGYGQEVSMDYVSRYDGPIAILMVLPDGTLAETPSVAMARAAHLAALEKAKALWASKPAHGSYGSSNTLTQSTTSAGSTSNQYLPPPSPQGTGSVGDEQNLPPQGNYGDELNKPYHGPLAMPMVLPSGFLVDTPIIAAARTAHLQALLKAQADAAKWKPKDWQSWQ